MLKSKNDIIKTVSWWTLGVVILALAVACAPESVPTEEPAAPLFRKMPAGQETSGFLGDYSNLKPDPDLEGDTLGYVNEEAYEGLDDYIAVIVDPVEIYMATDVDESLIPTDGIEAVKAYFRYALIDAVSDAFPLMEGPGPLTLRLRAALTGIDVGDEVAGVDESLEPLQRQVDVGEVIVELELVDSLTGKRIAAMVDKALIGEDARIGAKHFSRSERFDEAQLLLDEWAERVREFLDAKHELEGEAAERRDREYKPY
jgi:hypothetical protein